MRVTNEISHIAGARHQFFELVRRVQKLHYDRLNNLYPCQEFVQLQENAQKLVGVLFIRESVRKLAESAYSWLKTTKGLLDQMCSVFALNYQVVKLNVCGFLQKLSKQVKSSKVSPLSARSF